MYLFYLFILVKRKQIKETNKNKLQKLKFSEEK